MYLKYNNMNILNGLSARPKNTIFNNPVAMRPNRAV